MVLYRNEAYILEDYVKKYSNLTYKNLRINTMLDIYNELLRGIHITIYNEKLDYGYSTYINIEIKPENYSFSKLYEDIINRIKEGHKKIIDNIFLK